MSIFLLSSVRRSLAPIQHLKKSFPTTLKTRRKIISKLMKLLSSIVALSTATRRSRLLTPCAAFCSLRHFPTGQHHRIPYKSNPIFINTQNQRPITMSTSETSKLESDRCIYLDYNGTTPIDKRVVNAMMPYLTQHFGNPSSSHYFGQIPKEAVSKARTSILSLLHDDEATQQSPLYHKSIIFTGCGTEADNLAIHLSIQSNPHIERPHIVTSNVEHPAIAQYLKALEEEKKISVTYVPVNEEGMVSAQDMIEAIDSRPDDTVLVTLMLANNESGTLQPVQEVSKHCREKSILFHTDAAQAVGKVSIGLNDKGIGEAVDMVTIVGHKFGAPKGIACLYVRPDCFVTEGSERVEPKHYMLLGGGQEGGKRAGTENVPYCVALGAAADIIMEKKEHDFQWQQNAHWMKAMRYRLYRNLVKGLGEDIVRNNGPDNQRDRLPNTLSVGLKDVQSGELLRKIQMRVACSAGSACHASGGKVSAILEAMKVPMEYAKGTLRLSVGPTTTEEEIDTASEIIINEVKEQLSMT